MLSDSRDTDSLSEGPLVVGLGGSIGFGDSGLDTAFSWLLGNICGGEGLRAGGWGVAITCTARAGVSSEGAGVVTGGTGVTTGGTGVTGGGGWVLDLPQGGVFLLAGVLPNTSRGFSELSGVWSRRLHSLALWQVERGASSKMATVDATSMLWRFQETSWLADSER